MSELEDFNPPQPSAPEARIPPAKPRRLRSSARKLGRAATAVLALLAASILGLYFWATSAAFEDLVRRRLIAALEEATGGRVEIAAFHWDLPHLRAEAGGIVVHGLEAPAEAPYARVDRLRAQIAVLGVFLAGFSPRIVLREAELSRPEFHLIVYPDGTTNQPHPRHQAAAGKPPLDTLFDAQIGKLTVEQGTLRIADAVVPLNLQAEEISLRLNWAADAAEKGGGSYRIQLALGRLAFAQGQAPPVPSRLDAELVLGRDTVLLDRMQFKALGQTLNLRGRLTDFAHPAWLAQAEGRVDLRILAPYTGFPFVRGGVLGLHSSAAGHGGQFEITGDLASSQIHYQDPVVDARTANFSARFRCDPRQLLVSGIHLRIAQGGDVDGEFQFDNWLESTPPPAQQRLLLRQRKPWLKPTGTVRARLQGVSLDTILLDLASPAYRHLGLDTLATGEATASWTGFAEDLSIAGQLALAPSAVPVAGEVPVQGSIDAAFHADSGSIKVRTLDLSLPKSSLKGTGLLGVYPIDRSSEMALDFQSSDLAEFDGVLRTLGLVRGGRVGASALPVALQGQAEFHGQFNSSWLTPRVEGRVTATRIAIEMPTLQSALPGTSIPAAASGPNALTQSLTWDSVDLDGLYTPSSIVVRHGLLRRGAASLLAEGHLNSTDPKYKIGDREDEFDARSPIALKLTAKGFPLEQLAALFPVAGSSVSVAGNVTGQLNAQIAVAGQAGNLSGSATVEVDRATLFGEALEHLQAGASISGQNLKIASLTARFSPASEGEKTGGTLVASGSYDLNRNSFQLNARGAAIDLAAIEHLKQTGASIGGKLAFTAIGGGTLDDPRLQANATLSGLKFAGEPAADIQISASTRPQTVLYDVSSRQPGGEFTAHGETRFGPDFYTQANLQFARFDIGALLKVLHVTGISGQSALEGTAKISGPLAHPDKIRGEANLNQLAFDIQGVPIASKGAVHATLVEGVARLDPLELTGEDTDIRLNGSLALTGNRRLDLKADGAVNMRLAATLDPDLIASGITKFQMEAHGPLAAPILQGKVEFQNAALALADFPNGLSQIQGTLEFIQNRLEVRSLTAMSGGGQLSVAGYLGFQHGLYADLSATGRSIRIRYPEGISSLADANLKLQGPQNNLQLSGNVQVMRFAINSGLDIAALASQTAAPALVPGDAPSNHLRLDVHLTSSPQLNFQNAYAKLAGNVDLHLRGTLAAPQLLGKISLTEGSTSVSGTKYELQRGDINFTNPVRIQPNIDIDATARVEDYDITLGLHGSSDKPRLTYRSEPPLPEADIIALLALGRTADEASNYGLQQQQGADNANTDALLGGALNATVSNRVQRLFGTGAVKIDPNFIGSLGNSTARVTVVEQIGNNVTFTYASNVNTTTQQLIQAEIAINRHLSLLVTQDESGIFSVVLKNRRRFK